MEKSYKLLSISGGATKIGGLAGVADSLINKLNYKPDYIVGTSAGAILALPIAMGYWSVIRYESINFKLHDIFSKSPMNEDGEITFNAKLRVIFGKNSLGVQDKMLELLSKIIPPIEFERYRVNKCYPIIYIGMVDYKSGARIYKNIKECSYEEYLQYVLASSSIPYAAEPVYIGDKILFDGGARDHIGSHWMMENIDGIVENVSIYSRPKDFASILNNDWEPKNILDVFDRDQAIRVLETSKKDEKLEKLIANDLNIKHTAIFIPSILKSLYDTNPQRIAKLYREGEKAALKYYGN